MIMPVWMQGVVQHQWDPMVEIPTHLKRKLVGRGMKRFVVVVLNIGETLIPHAYIFGVVDVKDIHDHSINDICLVVSLGVEGDEFGELGVQ